MKRTRVIAAVVLLVAGALVLQVAQAQQPGIKRTVALKMMSSLANDERARKRFWRESQGRGERESSKRLPDL